MTWWDIAERLHKMGQHWLATRIYYSCVATAMLYGEEHANTQAYAILKESGVEIAA